MQKTQKVVSTQEQRHSELYEQCYPRNKETSFDADFQSTTLLEEPEMEIIKTQVNELGKKGYKFILSVQESNKNYTKVCDTFTKTNLKVEMISDFKKYNFEKHKNFYDKHIATVKGRETFEEYIKEMEEHDHNNEYPINFFSELNGTYKDLYELEKKLHFLKLMDYCNGRYLYMHGRFIPECQKCKYIGKSKMPASTFFSSFFPDKRIKLEEDFEPFDSMNNSDNRCCQATDDCEGFSSKWERVKIFIENNKIAISRGGRIGELTIIGNIKS